MPSNSEPQESRPADKIRDAFIDKLHEMVGICGHCGKRKCPGRAQHSRIPETISKWAIIDAINYATRGEQVR